MDWARMLAYITGTVDRELLLRNEYLATENRILKAQLKGRLLLTEAERATLSKLILFGEASLRRALAGISGALSPGTQSPRQREHSVVPFHDQTCGAG